MLKTGASAPDFEVTSLDGGTVKLSNYRGKFVLLDFWATWCGPCVAEIPHLQKTYEAFGKDPRFVMLSLSLDENQSAPKKFVKQRELNWAQGFLGKWADSKVPNDYGVQGIPALFLISPEGKIVAQDLRGEAVRAAVAKELK